MNRNIRKYVSENCYEIARVEWDKMNSPGVYLMMNGDIVLYIGCSERPLSRVNRVDHLAKHAFPEMTSLLILPCNSLPDAMELEQLLIRDLRPKYNRRGQKCSSDVAAALGITKSAARHTYLSPQSASRDKVESELVPAPEGLNAADFGNEVA